jgi:hypothetical protein
MESHEALFKDESDARGAAKELRTNEALDIRVRVSRDAKSGRWIVTVRPSAGEQFDRFDNGYVLGFLSAWRLAAEGS